MHLSRLAACLQLAQRTAPPKRRSKSSRKFPRGRGCSIRDARWTCHAVANVADTGFAARFTATPTDGRIEFAFTPTDGERILPASRFFPVSSSGGWLRSSVIDGG